jgi:hypothetical protein
LSENGDRPSESKKDFGVAFFQTNFTFNMELMTRKDDETLRDWWFKFKQFKKQHIGFLTAKYLRKGSGERPLNKCLDRPQQKGDTFQCDLL